MRSAFLISTILFSLGASAAPFLAADRVSSLAVVKRHSDHSTTQDASSNPSFTTEVTIHESCSPAQTHHLRQGLEEMLALAKHAKGRVLEKGETDQLYMFVSLGLPNLFEFLQKFLTFPSLSLNSTYFGNASSASVIGYYSQIALGNKAGVVLRCDDPDKNCATQTTAEGPWAGHYRGKNASEETVICPPSFNITNRVSLSELCWDGRLIGSGNPSHYLGADLSELSVHLHRLTHIPSVTFNHVIHAEYDRSDSSLSAEDYVESLELASTNNSLAAFNSDTLQFFALDAYARDVAYAPNGCTVSMDQAMAEEAAGGHSH
ncbi:BQ2448_6111 [Microbotryum intermedium]|uniref:BQ2448_6111 protein n=1 Tax=Microbotryum intermedium TaxID=269621 RepID=A0A238FND4_9BASI|nr:BQ2448_6111 [Microbotryum intermedium]